MIKHLRDTSVEYLLQSTDSREVQEILLKVLPKALDLFCRKNAEYGGEAAFDLGIAGQYSDMHRKMIKLRRLMWDNPSYSPEFEDLEEILQDLLGHILLTLAMLGREDVGGEEVEVRVEDGDKGFPVHVVPDLTAELNIAHSIDETEEDDAQRTQILQAKGYNREGYISLRDMLPVVGD